MKLPPITPGPWNDEDKTDRGEVYSAAYPGRPIATATSYWQGSGPRREERQANARVISQVPAMLELLVELREGTKPDFPGRLAAVLRAAGVELESEKPQDRPPVFGPGRWA